MKFAAILPMALACVAWDAGAASATNSLQAVYSFPPGVSPASGLALGSDGNYYGVISNGGIYPNGAVFEWGGATNFFILTGTNGAAAGSAPLAPLLEAGGSFYGTCPAGGTNNKGTVFRLPASGALTTIATFNGTNGATPTAPLTQGTNGLLYGTTSSGGANGMGTVFVIGANGGLTNLFSFDGTNGANPMAGLTRGLDGNLYGTTAGGGAHSGGTIFRLSYAGALSNIYSFNSNNGALPGELLADANGNLWGTMLEGGPNEGGMLFELTPSNSFAATPLPSGQSANPFLIRDAADSIYGTTQQGGQMNAGTIFEFSPTNGPGLITNAAASIAGISFTTVAAFSGSNGATPLGPVVFGTNGNLYGTTAHGGANGSGVIFSAIGFGPRIIKQPASVKWRSGATATFTVTAAGTAPLSYQWDFNNAALASQTNDSLVINNEALTNSGSYTVVIANSYGVVTSSVAQLSLPKPTVAIAAHPASVTTSQWTFTGSAADSVGLSGVEYFLNTNAWTNATGTNRWSASVILTPGSNVFSVRSLDPLGNPSATNAARIFYTTHSILTLSNNGPGTILTSFRGDDLVVGRSYIVRAVPSSGYVFSNWIGSNSMTGAVSNSANPFVFLMQSNMELTANFVANPFPGMAGAYNGLFTNENITAANSGMLDHFVVNNNGVYSGQLWLAGARYGLSGQISVWGNGTHLISRSSKLGGAVLAQWTIDWSASPPILTGFVSNEIAGGWISSLLAGRSTNNMPSSESTMLLASTNGPAGESYFLLTNNNGNVTLTAGMADGTVFTQSSSVSETTNLPVFANLYGGAGVLLGWITLTNNTPAGTLWWIKSPSIITGRYAEGFTNISPVLGSTWTNAVLSSSSVHLLLNGGNLSAPILLDASINENQIEGGSVSGSINQKTGKLTLLFQNPAGGNSAAYGAMLQQTNFGGGYFLTPYNAGGLFVTNSQ